MDNTIDPKDRAITFAYTNWRGEHSTRTAIPLCFWFGATEWHSEPQWLMTAMDVEKQAQRDFALLDMSFRPPAPGSVGARELATWLCGDAANSGLLRDVAFTVWSKCHAPTHEDGNTDWGNDTLPLVNVAVAQVRTRILSALEPDTARDRAPSREQFIAAMSTELDQHKDFRGDAVHSLVWAARMYDAAIRALRSAPAPEDRGWQP